MKEYLTYLCQGTPDMQAIPDADSFSHPRKKGNLLKLIGRGWLSSGSWKKRFCVLDGTKLYYYENETSHGADKSSGVLSLDYYDVCEEFDAKDKKNAFVFIIATSVKGFFDNRHQFSAETSQEMQDWIRSVHDVIADARNSRSRGGRSRIGNDKVSPVSGNRIVILSQMRDDLGEEELNTDEDHPSQQLVNATKDRVKGPQGRRLPNRKSMMPAGSPSEEDFLKQRSFSLSSPNEEEETEEGTSNEQKRISLSMDEVNRDGIFSDETRQRSNSGSEQLSQSEQSSTAGQRFELGPSKKPIFGRLGGGQHAALTKELELKLKSGMAPGGRRFHPQRSEEEEEIRIKSRTPSETDELDKKMDAVNTKLNTVQNSVDGLERAVIELKRSATDQNRSIQDQILQDIMKQASTALKEIQDTTADCKEALVEARQARDEHRQLAEECRKVLSQLKDTQNSITPPDMDET